LHKPIAAEQSNKHRASRHPAIDKNGFGTQLPNYWEYESSNCNLAEFNAEIEGDQGDRDPAAVRAHTEFAQDRGEAEAVN